MQTLRRFLELIRFSHTLFALPFALTAALLAWHDKGRVQVVEVVGILLCMVFARSAAMAFNRLVDRRIDAGNPRTASRHLPAGLLSVPAVAFFTILCGLGFTPEKQNKKTKVPGAPKERMQDKDKQAPVAAPAPEPTVNPALGAAPGAPTPPPAAPE